MQASSIGAPPLADEAIAILEGISEGFFAVAADWTFTYVNRQAGQFLGADPGHLVGRKLSDLDVGLRGSAFEALCRTAMAEGAPAGMTARHPVQGGWHEMRVQPMPAGLAVYLRDVTAQVQAEQALRESERTFRMMADSIPQIVWIVEASGEAVYFNRQWRNYTGVHIDSSTPASVAGEFVHPADREATLVAWERAYRDGGVFHVEHRIRSRDGDYRWFLVLAEPYRNCAGVIERWFGTSTDIHGQKMAKMALAESELRFRALTNATSDVVFRMSPDWSIMHELDGRGFLKTASGLGEYRIEDYVDPQDLGIARAAIDAAIRGKATFALEHRVLRADGSSGWTYSRAVPILDDAGAIREWIGMASDITARKAAEEQLREADRRKDDFLAMLGHELRNPLAPIKAATQLLQTRMLDEPAILRTSQVIERQIGHMTNLIDELLDMSRVSKNLIRLDKIPVDLGDVVHDAVEQAAPLVQARRHQLDVLAGPDAMLVLGDKKRLVQVVTNLLNNAAKFTDQGGHIALALRASADEVRIEVADNGIGMTPAMTRQAFELFAQAELSADRTMGGLGLGLALVKSLVELHGGTVNCHSDGLGRGSRFTIVLPRLHAAAPPEPAPVALALPAQQALRILVVDDNVDAAQMLAMLLESSGHEVAVEHSPSRALRHALARPPQLCLLDIGLPEMDGYELAARLRARSETAGVVLVAVTGYGQASDREKSLAAGFDHHLVKPIAMDRLRDILAQVRGGAGPA
ncbi:PAS domain S-box protein [[Empedobacter] haloabium]|uniref:histidine kinase n=1 Tax=[Empedobacter] haloabium TaxID=592317 RepID=A0ABZ1UQV7_9BURK